MPAKSLQSCLTLCDPMDYRPPGSSVHGILQARILEWAAMPSSRGKKNLCTSIISFFKLPKINPLPPKKKMNKTEFLLLRSLSHPFGTQTSGHNTVVKATVGRYTG